MEMFGQLMETYEPDRWRLVASLL